MFLLYFWLWSGYHSIYTQHIQEDAYIHFRSAQNLAETGIFGFNKGEKVSASTSIIYVLLISIIYLFFRDLYIIFVLLTNTFLLIMAIYFISSCLTLDFNKKLLIWLFASLTPIALLISYSGMETSLLIFLISLIIYSFWGKGSTSISYFAIALLP